MSTFMDKISHIVSLANSAKVADHKKAIKYLTELWEDHSEEDLQQISNYSDYLLSSEGTRQEGYYSLNDVFIIVHNLFESEINRIHNLKGQNSGKLDKERITKLLYRTSDKASNHLKPKTVVNSTLSVLQYHKVQIFSEYYEVYLSILRKYVLRERSQRVLVPYAQWQELLQVCTTILEHKVDDINYVELLETLELVVRHGCSLSNLLFETKKLLPVISDLFENYQSYNIKSTDILFKLCFTVCQQIASDSRYILCSFSESLPLSLIEFKGPEEKYELYLLFVQVHHPNGALLRDDASHVCDVDKWKATLQLLYKMVLKDIKLAILPKSHLALACEVFRQKMFTKIPESLTQSSMFQESAYIQPRKKRRISDSEAQDRLIDLVNDRDPERAWPIIQIAASLYKKYPDCLKFDECIEFLDVIVKLMSQSKDFSIMESLCELATVIAQNNEIHAKDDLGIYWNKIWDAVLRFLSMSHKQIVEKGCVLIQNLIYYKRISNPQSILKLFTSKSIQKSNHSIQTLKVFCENNILPNDLPGSDVNSELLTNNSLKLQLLRWNLDPFPKRLTHSSSIENFSKLLIGFTMKTWYKQNPQVLQVDSHDEYCTSMENNFYEDMQSITIDDIEQCYLCLNSKNHLAFNLNIQNNIPISDEENFDNPFVVEDLDFLLNNLLQIVQMEGAENELDVFIIKTALIATVITDLKAMNMIQSSFDEFCLVQELKTCLSKIMIEISSIDWSKYLRRMNYTLEITRALTLLYQTKFDTSVNNIIINATTCDAVKKIYEIRQHGNSESPKLPICQINAIIALALCSCMNIGQDMMDFQLKVASTLLKMKKYRLSNKTDVISVLTVLKIFSNVPNTRETDQLTELLMIFVQQLFIEWQRDDRVNRCILQLLPKFLDKVAALGDEEHIHDIFMICKHYHDKFARGEFGQLTHLSLVKCFNSIVNHRTFTYSSENEVLDDDAFMTFVKSPYYLVRFESLKYVYSIFSSKKIDHAWKENFFLKLRDFVVNIFIIQRDLTADEIQEERLIRGISVLQTLTTVICSQSIFQSPALLTLAEIVRDKDIDTGVVQKGLKAIDNCGLSSKNIIECNLNYILTNWCRSDRSLISFPFILTDCTTDTSFYETYAHIIFPVLIREGKIEESKRFCSRLEAPFQDLFKSCCANIVPWALSGETPDVLEKMQSNAGLFQDIGDFSTLVRRNLHQIIAETVQRLRDLNHFYAVFKTTTNLPDRDPPHYKRDVVDQCFDRLNQIVFDEHPSTLFHCILTRQPSISQKVLLQLTRNIYADCTTEYRALALHQYAYFCQKIIVDLTESYCDVVATYFIKDIISTLLHLAKEDDRFIVDVACTYLHVLLEDLLPNRSAQVGQILDFCIKSLAPLVSESNRCEPARNVLELLLIRNKECLAEQIKYLTVLPDCEPWNTRLYNNYRDADNQELKESLRDFMKASDDHDCNVDSLRKLKRQLTIKESELEALYEELESSQGFAEDCASSLLHNLIYRLIQLTKSKDAKIALEAAKCLGVLGPANLFTTILHPQERPIKESNKIEILTNKFCQILADLVLSADIETRTISSDALYVLSEYECRGNSESLQEFLFPFQSAHKLKVSRKKIKLELDDSQLYETFDRVAWWSTKSDEPYKAWISGLTSAVATVITGFCTENLIPLFKLDVHSCEMALPRLLDIIIETDASMAGMICNCINTFFHHHFGPSFSLSDVSKKMRENNARDAVRCILNVVHHLRIQTDEKIHLDFDYLTIAVAAQFCSAYFSSILYTELWCQSKLKSSCDFDSIPIIDQICEDHCSRGKDAQDILREAYIKIGDSDSIHGWGCSYLEEQKPKIPYYTNFQKLDKLALLHDIDCSIRKVPERGLITALRGLSLHYLATRLLNTATSQADSMDDLNYDCFWRLSDWNQVTNFQTSSSNNETGNFSTFHYESLKCLHESNKSSLNKSLEKAHFCIIKELNNISLESCKAVYPKLTQLQMLHEIEEFNSSDPKEYDNLLKKWMGYKYICNNDLQYVEPILTQRTVICKIRESFRNNFQYAFVGTQYKIAQLAQQEGNFNVAGRALEIVSKEKGFDYNDIYRLKYHEALLALKTKDEDMARYNFRSIINYEHLDPSLRAQVLRDYGNWIAENKSENPQAIISKYFEKAIAAYADVTEMAPEDFSDQSKALAALAQFSHEQYLIICDYMNSSQFESLQECIDYSRNVNNNKPIKKGDKDVERAFIITDRQSRIDSIEVANIKKDKAMYLALALTNYLQTLQKSDEHDFLNFRLVSLWLSAENMYDGEVNRLLEGQLERIPSYKFIPLVPQLAPHMSNVTDTFTSKINKLLERCAKDHPHHTLPVLLALKNLYGDSKYCNKKNSTLEARVLGAQQLVQQLLSSDIRPIVQEMDKTSEALVMLAYYDADKKKVAVPKCSIPRNLLINEIKNFKHSLVPTMTLDIKKNCSYTNIVSIRKYESSYDNVGGINAPKKIICIGTDGVQRPQLVKGRDDLRQDAVMQQVFTVMNSLLKSNKDAKQRNLHVRTYKVVPLTQRSGVLEWCNNTLPLSCILTGDGKRSIGLHQKYYPKNYSPIECRKRIQAAKGNQLFNVFMDCCKNLPPAFHHFFTENYLSPEIWFERRSAYTRSVATTSIIGYILGLGDRHVSNILIDQSTAEVIHIDFGIAFEQGKVLPTPETVPFRLTRDMEAGMGVTGVEGTMRRCCEETVSVLREQKEIIVTLLRVLLYDPLYSWAITPAKAATYQSEHSSRSSESKDSNSPGIAETNKLAERALLRVQQKLQGIEEGVSSNISGQVTRLIQQARDPANLCRLFAGWQAYL